MPTNILPHFGKGKSSFSPASSLRGEHTTREPRSHYVGKTRPRKVDHRLQGCAASCCALASSSREPALVIAHPNFHGGAGRVAVLRIGRAGRRTRRPVLFAGAARSSGFTR